MVAKRKTLLRSVPLFLPLCAWALISAQAANYVPALFIFGDSLVDTGNNDKLLTIARANHMPYGKDFIDGRPTGRFSDGQIAVDYLASFLGLPFPPPYLLADDNILRGVNFASGGSGILNSTGDVFGQHISLSQQVKYFTDVRRKLIATLGYKKTSIHISKALYFIVVGSNDYLINYFILPVGTSPLQLQYTSDAFVNLLITQLEQQLLNLYTLGARKFAVASLPPLGCVPVELFLFRSSHGECISFINDEVINYNRVLFSILKQLKLLHPDAEFVYLDTYAILEEIISYPSSYGIKYINRACCGLGPFGAASPCVQNFSPVCNNASEFAFWDLYHPTSLVNLIAITKFWEGGSPYVYPYNIKDLAAM